MMWQLLGVVAAGVSFGAYVGLSLGRLQAQGYAYQGLNLLAGVLFFAYGLAFETYAACVMNVLWGAVTVAALWRIHQEKRRPGDCH